MRTLLIKTAVIFLALLGFATAQMKAEIPIIQADTVFAGFGGGELCGVREQRNLLQSFAKVVDTCATYLLVY